VLQGNKIRISMDGRGAWRDNVFVERLWKSVKYEEVYLHAYDSVAEAKARIHRPRNLSKFVGPPLIKHTDFHPKLGKPDVNKGQRPFLFCAS